MKVNFELKSINNNLYNNRNSNKSNSNIVTFASIRPVKNIEGLNPKTSTLKKLWNYLKTKFHNPAMITSKTKGYTAARKRLNELVAEKQLSEFVDVIASRDAFNYHNVRRSFNFDTVDKDGNNIVMRALNRHDACGEIWHKLDEDFPKDFVKNIDWIALDKDGNNSLMRYINSHVGFHKQNCSKLPRSWDDNHILCQIEYGLKRLLSKYNAENINYINPKTKLTALQQAILGKNEYFIRHILDCPGIDISVSHPDTSPALFLASKNRMDIGTTFQDLLNHRTADFDAIYNGQTFYKTVMPYNNEALIEHTTQKVVDEIAEDFTQNKQLFINKILNATQYLNFNKIIHKELNSKGENLGHLLAEIELKNDVEMYDIKFIINRLSEYYNFCSKDNSNQTAIHKAIKLKNIEVLKLLLQGTAQDIRGIAKKVPEDFKDYKYDDNITPFMNSHYRDLLFAKIEKQKIYDLLKTHNINDPTINELVEKACENRYPYWADSSFSRGAAFSMF